MAFTRQELEFYHDRGLMPDWAYYQQVDMPPEKKLEAQTRAFTEKVLAEMNAREEREAQKRREQKERTKAQEQEKELEKELEKSLDKALDKALGDLLKDFPGYKG